MKKILQRALLLLILLFAQTSFAESIENYSVEMNLQKDSSIQITETIQYDFGDLQRHGIFRFIPVTFDIEGQKHLYGLQQRKLDIDIQSVSIDGQSAEYTTNTKDQNGNYVIKIGDPNKTISGLHTYQINYKIDGSIRYFDNFDEIYWNAIGLDWQVDIKKANIILTSNGIPFQNYSCYTGSLGSQTECNSDTINQQQISFSHENLAPKQGITIAASVEKGILPVHENTSFSLMGIVFGIVAAAVAGLGFVWYAIRKYSRKYFVYDPIHPRYTPPEKLNPMFTGYIVDNKFDPRDISAGIIQLAIDGYIHIEHVEKTSWFGSADYIFTLKKDINEIVAENNQARNFLMYLLFHKSSLDIMGNIFGSSGLQSQSIMTSVFETISTDVITDTSNFLNEQRLSEIPKSNGTLIIKKKNLEKFYKAFATEQGYREEKQNNINPWFFAPFIVAFVLFIIGQVIIGIFVFVITFIILATIGAMQSRYTKKGWETKHTISGFKLFLEMTEKDRYEFHNNPANNPQEFMEYLPYAIALGVEKKWAEQFKSITMENPDWYSGSGNFAPAVFASQLSSFSTSVTSAVSTQGQSGSGSGGGGFSGGGSGGGGGGSW